MLGNYVRKFMFRDSGIQKKRITIVTSTYLFEITIRKSRVDNG